MPWLLLFVVPYLITYLYIFTGLIRSNIEELPASVIDRNGDIDSESHNRLISVIVPIHNEAGNITALINNLNSQSYPESLTEVLLIDDNSSDGTSGMLKDKIKHLKNFKVCQNIGSGKKAAIHTGIKISKGELIVTTDADAVFGPDWLSSIVECWQSTFADVIIGPVQMDASNRFLNPFVQLEHLSVQGLTMATANLGRPVMASGANLAFTKAISKRYGSYIRKETESGDDMFLLHYAKRSRKKILFNNYREGIVKTSHTGNLKDLLRQRARWSGKGVFYNDTDTIILGLVTFLTSIVIFSSALASIFNHMFISVTLMLLLLKSIPDLLILINMTLAQNRIRLMFWFIPVALTYPGYVTLVTLYGFLFKPAWRR